MCSSDLRQVDHLAVRDVAPDLAFLFAGDEAAGRIVLPARAPCEEGDPHTARRIDDQAIRAPRRRGQVQNDTPAFDLPLATARERLVRSSELAEVFRRHDGGRFGQAYGRQLQGLSVASRGFLTGSIDLVFRCGERWWVADWKSNFLGQRDGRGAALRCGPNDYATAAMEQLMASNHYPLQAHLYLVALHRYLRWRLPGYTPEHHLGGYAYVFLRGVPGPMDSDPADGVPGVLVERPPLQRLLAQGNSKIGALKVESLIDTTVMKRIDDSGFFDKIAAE